MKDITKDAEREFCVLSHLVQNPVAAKYLVERLALDDDAFSSESRISAFHALVAEPSADSSARLQLARQNLPELAENDFTDIFLGLAPVSSTIIDDFQKLAALICDRNMNRAFTDIMRREMSPEQRSEALAKANSEITEIYNHAREALASAQLPAEGEGAEPQPLRPANPRPTSPAT